MKILASFISVSFLLVSNCHAQPYRVLENSYYGLEGESQFLVEDNGTLTTPVNRKPHKPKQVSNPGGGYVYREVYQPENYHAEHAIWNPLLLKQQIINISIQLQNPILPHRDLYLQRKVYLETILSVVESEIAHSPKLSR